MGMVALELAASCPHPTLSSPRASSTPMEAEAEAAVAPQIHANGQIRVGQRRWRPRRGGGEEGRVGERGARRRGGGVEGEARDVALTTTAVDKDSNLVGATTSGRPRQRGGTWCLRHLHPKPSPLSSLTSFLEAAGRRCRRRRCPRPRCCRGGVWVVGVDGKHEAWEICLTPVQVQNSPSGIQACQLI
uniref:DUF834 domain-containing protein n=1 Tax=Oryza nivara TaxID=4536 RepID=A0A0E0GR85_ORYNI